MFKAPIGALPAVEMPGQLDSGGRSVFNGRTCGLVGAMWWILVVGERLDALAGASADRVGDVHPSMLGGARFGEMDDDPSDGGNDSCTDLEQGVA